MKVAVFIMSTNCEPSISNVNAMKDTFVKYASEHELAHEYTFIEYVADDSEDHMPNIFDVDYELQDENLNFWKATVLCKESIYRTFEKTYAVFSTFYSKFGKFDLYIRINISTFLNMAVLDSVIGSLDLNTVYCSALNSIMNLDSEYVNVIYPRGDFIMFGDEIMDVIVEGGVDEMYSDTRLDTTRSKHVHVDDVIIGVVLYKAFGKSYLDIYKEIGYNPYIHTNVGDLDPNMRYIPSRVKTCPPGVTFSGYSWDDNEWRRRDCEKMKRLQNMVDELPPIDAGKAYDGIFADCEREIMFAFPTSCTLSSLKRIKKSKSL